MSFKENILKKIQIKRLAEAVLSSIGPPGSGASTDLESMRLLLEMREFPMETKRGLDLYFLEKSPDPETGRPLILALDNELAIYRTFPEDAAMRKNPLIKEMVHILKIIKILNDGDVLVSKRDVSLETVREKCLADLDLSFQASDIEALAEDGRVAFELSIVPQWEESLVIFAEILGYGPLPKPFETPGSKALGAVGQGPDGEAICGPIVLYDKIQGALGLMEETIGARDREGRRALKKTASGMASPAFEGAGVFGRLKTYVLEKG
ncbi:conserved hypothetical protein [Candidatus Desulfarcum epimagneticum]|uniref:Uncharacterized protein n=1 Tax=uncultured Desulfobacteraceae bacterium TaxID=218296 RepID=A0A484HG21_9BACT|nr:conserved hypothetical protein [uncultured Desulfobacteraceae bacterium]